MFSVYATEKKSNHAHGLEGYLDSVLKSGIDSMRSTLSPGP